jgi:hypothetical protein
MPITLSPALEGDRDMAECDIHPHYCQMCTWRELSLWPERRRR